jgi:hypothetical protein
MPPRFERYAKIFHWLDARYENIDDPLSPEEIKILGIPDCTELRSLVERRRSGELRTRILWREAAQALDVQFQPELVHEWFWKKLRQDESCWSRFIAGPSDGNLEPEEYRQLTSTLAPFTRDQHCFFRFSQRHYLLSGKPLLFEGVLDELDSFLVSRAEVSPEYWWPEDRSWCVCSDYDLFFTVVGGTSALISAILENPILETLEVASTTRIDSIIPMPLPAI